MSTTGASSSGAKTLYIIGGYETKGESSQAVPYFEKALKLAVTRPHAGGAGPSNTSDSRRRAPCVVGGAGLPRRAGQEPRLLDGSGRATCSSRSVRRWPRPTADVRIFRADGGSRSGPAGGDNIFLLRPLNERLRPRHRVRLRHAQIEAARLSLVSTSFGSTAEQAVDNTVKNFPKCKVVHHADQLRCCDRYHAAGAGVQGRRRRRRDLGELPRPDCRADQSDASERSRPCRMSVARKPHRGRGLQVDQHRVVSTIFTSSMTACPTWEVTTGREAVHQALRVDLRLRRRN